MWNLIGRGASSAISIERCVPPECVAHKCAQVPIAALTFPKSSPRLGKPQSELWPAARDARARAWHLNLGCSRVDWVQAGREPHKSENTSHATNSVP